MQFLHSSSCFLGIFRCSRTRRINHARPQKQFPTRYKAVGIFGGNQARPQYLLINTKILCIIFGEYGFRRTSIKEDPRIRAVWVTSGVPADVVAAATAVVVGVVGHTVPA